MDKDGPTFRKTIRNTTSFLYGLISTKKEFRAKATSTSVDTIGNSVRTRSRVFLQSKEVTKLSLIKSPINVIRSLLNKSQSLFMLTVPRAFLTCLENGSPILTKSSTRVILFSKRWPSSSVRALRVSTGFLLRQARWLFLHLAKAMHFSVCVQGKVETSVSRVDVCEDFHE